MVRERGLGVFLLALLLPAGAASAANREHLQMMAEIRMLQEQTSQLRGELAALNETLRALGKRLDDQAGASRKAYADQKLAVDTVLEDLRIVREKVDDNNVRISSLAQEVEALRAAIPPEGAAQTPPAAEGTPAAAPPAGAAAPPPAGQSPQKVYDAAWADYVAGQWNLAIAGFENFLRAFPRSEQAGDAQYFIGECYYQQGLFKEAASAYDRGIAAYPSSPKIPDMYYKRGMAFNALGLVDRARESWEFAVKNFPTSDAGRLARQALNQIIRRDRPSAP